jgi:hypothetical protein
MRFSYFGEGETFDMLFSPPSPIPIHLTNTQRFQTNLTDTPKGPTAQSHPRFRRDLFTVPHPSRPHHAHRSSDRRAIYASFLRSAVIPGTFGALFIVRLIAIGPCGWSIYRSTRILLSTGEQCVLLGAHTCATVLGRNVVSVSVGPTLG